MDLISTFCLSVIVFLSLPLPLFTSAALAVCPSLRRSLMPWVWSNVVVGSVAGILIVATAFPPLAAAAIASSTFVVCGAKMFRQVALSKQSIA